MCSSVPVRLSLQKPLSALIDWFMPTGGDNTRVRERVLAGDAIL